MERAGGQLGDPVREAPSLRAVQLVRDLANQGIQPLRRWSASGTSGPGELIGTQPELAGLLTGTALTTNADRMEVT